MSKAVPSYLVDTKYYVMRDAGITYIYNNSETLQQSDKRVLRLMKQPIEAAPFNSAGNGNVVIHNDVVNPLVNLSDKEHKSIIDEEPTLDDLMQVYVLASNSEGVEMNFAIAEKVW